MGGGGREYFSDRRGTAPFIFPPRSFPIWPAAATRNDRRARFWIGARNLVVVPRRSAGRVRGGARTAGRFFIGDHAIRIPALGIGEALLVYCAASWGGSSAGRASRSQCEGREFDPPPLHHESERAAQAALFLFHAAGMAYLRTHSPS